MAREKRYGCFWRKADCLAAIFLLVAATAHAKAQSENYAIISLDTTQDLCPVTPTQARSRWNVFGTFMKLPQILEAATSQHSSQLAYVPSANLANPAGSVHFRRSNVRINDSVSLSIAWMKDETIEYQSDFTTWQNAIERAIRYAIGQGICIPHKLQFALPMLRPGRYRVALPRGQDGAAHPVIQIPYNFVPTAENSPSIANSVELDRRFDNLPAHSPFDAATKTILHEIGHVLHEYYASHFYWGFSNSYVRLMDDLDERYSQLDIDVADRDRANSEAALRNAQASCWTRERVVARLRNELADLQSRCDEIRTMREEILNKVQQREPLQANRNDICNQFTSYAGQNERECVAEIFTAAWLGFDVPTPALIFHAAAAGPPLPPALEIRLANALQDRWSGSSESMQNLVLRARQSQKTPETRILDSILARRFIEKFISVQHSVMDRYLPLEQSNLYRLQSEAELDNHRFSNLVLPLDVLVDYWGKTEVIRRAAEQAMAQGGPMDAKRFRDELAEAAFDLVRVREP